MTNPHDHLFRRAFGRVGNARDLLRSALSPALVRAIAWRSLRGLPGTFIDRRLRASHTDLLFSVRIRGRKVLIYVVIEHKSTGDRITVIQVLGYLHAIWMRHHKDHPSCRRLPPILPFVLHHGAEKFTGPTSLRDLLDLDGMPAELVAHQPDFSFVLDDLATETEDHLQDRVSSVFARLALLCLQCLRTGSPDEVAAMLREFGPLIERLGAARNGQDDLLALFSYILQIGCLPEVRLRTVLTEITPRSQKTMLTTAQQMQRRLRKELGPKLVAKGQVQGQARTLLLLLEKKFGPLAPAVIAKVKRARAATLDRWAGRILTEGSLDAVFAE